MQGLKVLEGQLWQLPFFGIRLLLFQLERSNTSNIGALRLERRCGSLQRDRSRWKRRVSPDVRLTTVYTTSRRK